MRTTGWQALVYQMRLDTNAEVAMVLPLPVAAGSGEQAVRFISYKDYPGFFDDLEAGFPKPVPAGSNRGLTLSAMAVERIAVQQVGDFEASFVPTPGDFNRLDQRFRLPEDAFKKLKGYEQYGFAVFKLKPGKQNVHPMAFEFQTALKDRLFFPTVHIHDGEVHAEADFDHKLYCQPSEAMWLKLRKWTESPQLASAFVNAKRSLGLVLEGQHLYKQELHGDLPNRDTFVEAVS